MSTTPDQAPADRTKDEAWEVNVPRVSDTVKKAVDVSKTENGYQFRVSKTAKDVAFWGGALSVILVIVAVALAIAAGSGNYVAANGDRVSELRGSYGERIAYDCAESYPGPLFGLTGSESWDVYAKYCLK